MNFKRTLHLWINRLCVMQVDFKHQYIVFMCEHGFLYKEHKVNRVDSCLELRPQHYRDFSTFRAKGRVEYCAEKHTSICENYYYPKHAEDTLENSVYTLIFEHNTKTHFKMKAVVTEFLLNYPNLESHWVKRSAACDSHMDIIHVDTRSRSYCTGDISNIPCEVESVPLDFSKLQYMLEADSISSGAEQATTLATMYSVLCRELPGRFDEMNNLLCGKDDNFEYGKMFVPKNRGCANPACEGVVVHVQSDTWLDVCICAQCGVVDKLSNLPLIPYPVWAERYQKCRNKILDTAIELC